MSRVGKRPIAVPPKTEVSYDGFEVRVKGPRGALAQRIHPEMKLEIGKDQIEVQRPSDGRLHRALHGLTRQLVANMVQGVTEGFTRQLEIVGVGYRAEVTGKRLVLQLGFSHPVVVVPPEGITFQVEGQNRVTVSGIDKQLVGELAARIRRLRRPEPYKGKGIRYVGEHVRRKAGKTAA